MERNPQFANCLQINGNLLDTQKDTKKTRLEAGRERKRAGENPKSGPLAKLALSLSRVSDEIQWNSQAAESAAIKTPARQLRAFIVKLPLKIETTRTNGRQRRAEPSAKRIS